MYMETGFKIPRGQRYITSSELLSTCYTLRAKSAHSTSCLSLNDTFQLVRIYLASRNELRTVNRKSLVDFIPIYKACESIN